MEERYILAIERIRDIAEDNLNNAALDLYFKRVAEFIIEIDDTLRFIKDGGLKTASVEVLLERNNHLYEDILGDRYDTSYGNPEYAVKQLGEEFGQLLSFLYTEMRSMIGFAYENRLDELVIRMELFLEIYGSFAYEIMEEGKLPTHDDIRDILYWFVSDYADEAALRADKELFDTDDVFAASIVMESDLDDIRYLFSYGDYISPNEIEMSKYMANLPEEIINTMADTYTEGYRIGFILGNKDLSKKETVEIRFPIGFEKMVRRSIENFAGLGLKPSIRRAPSSFLYNPSIHKTGYYGTIANRQFEFDHKDDRALFWDKNYINRKLEVMKTAHEEYKEKARLYAGPAVIETFGEREFNPVNKKERVKLSDEQNKLAVEYSAQAGELLRNYVIEEERSFTIIAFPIPEIGEQFSEIFDETIKINTLDYKLYRNIQQTLIDTLDTADTCHILGRGDNRTDLTVNLYKLRNPEKETIFENCVADVNIPVGEVFTSPVLQGTNGVLNVSRVFLNGLEFRNLTVTFENGMIKDYDCDNFEKEEDNKAFIKENILFRHETLPMGEFAIGTNTTAYVAARKYNIEAKLPILIAEKTGPHFAVGDTCYSHSEQVRVYNPDGKEIVAKDNEKSLLRDRDISKAYFNCHTDITIPYDELGEITAIRRDGSSETIIKNGRFVLKGCEELNKPLDEQQ